MRETPRSRVRKDHDSGVSVKGHRKNIEEIQRKGKDRHRQKETDGYRMKHMGMYLIKG